MSGQKITLDEVARFLVELAESESDSCLVGGLAVGLWAEELLNPERRVHWDMPLYSKDIDLRGQKADARLLLEMMRTAGITVDACLAVATRKNAPGMGRVFAFTFEWGTGKTTVEVLEKLPLLDECEGSHAICGTPLLVRGLKVLDPCSLMICKTHAFHTRTGGDQNNDLRHLQILEEIVSAFLIRVAGSDGSYDARRDARRLLDLLQNPQWPLPLSLETTERLAAALARHLVVS